MTNVTISYGQLPLCCGSIFLHNFQKRLDKLEDSVMKGLTKKQREQAGYTDAFIKQWTETHSPENVDEYKKRVSTYLKNHIKSFRGQKSYSTLILNELEHKTLHDTVVDAGFEVLVPMIRNPSGSSIIWYIAYHIQKPWEEKKVVRKSIFKKAS